MKDLKTNKLVITKFNNKIITAAYENNKMVQANAVVPGEALVGSIYIGKVKNIVKNINAAFVDIGGGKMCYLSLENIKEPIIVKSSNGKIHNEAEVVIQIQKEDVKTKLPAAVTSINFTGRYLVLIHSKSGIRISSKISDKAVKDRLKEWLLPYLKDEYGIIVRTNAARASKEVVTKEALKLIEQYETLKENCKYKTVYSCLKKGEEAFLSIIRDSYEGYVDEIVTDEEDLYESLKEYVKSIEIPDMDAILRFVPEKGSLIRLYAMQSALKEALSKNVWLKSGGYIVIEPTEALTVIDVNTGKAIDGKKSTDETFYKINLEAAVEIARQIRLRNLSGIIVVDFINLEDKEYRLKLMNCLSDEVKKDSIKTEVVDMTILNLVEMTRKRVTRPLHEQIRLEEVF